MTAINNPADTGKANRLINETSTYLLQHAYNPVDWYAWGPEALQRSNADGKPILLSIGYSACHWCHVMEHESFEDQQTADLMNELFVCIKVDREERPDLDEIYMKAVQMLTGHGGWPMTVFLTPELKPFFGGTYYPKEDRHGMPSFKRVLTSVSLAWNEQRDNVETSASEITSHLALFDKVPAGSPNLDHAIIERSLANLEHVFDPQYGGFGSAPKFPHTGSIALAMRYAAGSDTRAEKCLEIVETTLSKMAYGGIHDQLGGGFARYAVDRIWLVPHFEKMLYDNALIARNYFEAFQLTGRQYYARVAEGILRFVLRELTTDGGAFYSSLDADSEGEEGKFYVWKPEEIKKVLGNEDGAWFCDLFGCTASGNFEHGTSILNLSQSPEEIAKKCGLSEDALWARVDKLRERLLLEREKRVRPGRDDKVLTSWNSLMISAFVDGYKSLKAPQYLEVAKRAASFIIDNMYNAPVLLRTWGRGQAKLPGYLDDYSYFAQALLDLAAVDPDPKWYQTAIALHQYILDEFGDDPDGGFYYTSNKHEKLITRTRNFYDASTPSPTAVTVWNLLRFSRLNGDSQQEARAKRVLALYSPFFAKVADQFSYQISALDFMLQPSSEIALVVNGDEKQYQDMVWAVHQNYLPNTVSLIKQADNAALAASPLFEKRELLNGKNTAYICRNFTCDAPINDVDSLATAAKSLALKVK